MRATADGGAHGRGTVVSAPIEFLAPVSAHLPEAHEIRLWCCGAAALFGTSADKPVLAAGCEFDATGRDLGCEAFPPCE